MKKENEAISFSQGKLSLGPQKAVFNGKYLLSSGAGSLSGNVDKVNFKFLKSLLKKETEIPDIQNAQLNFLYNLNGSASGAVQASSIAWEETLLKNAKVVVPIIFSS